jgi:four helix bundle protein
MGNYRDLEAWRVSRALANATYRLTEAFPATERYGLAAQMRRAGVSIMSNIAEGAGRGSDAQFVQLVRIARGSLRELESQRLLAEDLGLVGQPALKEIDDLLLQQGRLLHALLRWLTHAKEA